MKKSGKKWISIISLLLIVLIVLPLCIRRKELSIDANDIETAEEKGNIEPDKVAILNATKEPTSSQETETQEADHEELKRTTSEEALKVVEITTDDTEKTTIIIEGNDGKQAKVEIGVISLDETLPFRPEMDEIEESKQEDDELHLIKETENSEPKSNDGSEEKIESTYSITDYTDITYQEYEAMSGQEQMLFYYSFANAEAFTEWYNNAKAEYEASIDKVYINADGSVDAG